MKTKTKPSAKSKQPAIMSGIRLDAQTSDMIHTMSVKLGISANVATQKAVRWCSMMLTGHASPEQLRKIEKAEAEQHAKVEALRREVAKSKAVKSKLL